MGVELAAVAGGEADALLVDVDDEAREAQLGGVGGGYDALAAQQPLQVLEVLVERERPGQQLGGGLAQGVDAVLVDGQRVDHHHPDVAGIAQRRRAGGASSTSISLASRLSPSTTRT